MRRRLGAWALGVVALASPGCSNRLFLHPSHDPIAVDAERIRIEGTRAPIRRTHFEALYRELHTDGARPRLYVLAFTGNAGRAEHELSAVPELLAPWLVSDGPLRSGPTAAADTRRGMGLLAVNYPGFGEDSEGPATLRRLGAAALDAYDHLVARADGAPIVVYGISMGTTAALHIAASKPAVPPAALILDRGPDIPGLVMGRFGWWNLWLAAGPVTLSLPRAVRSVPNARRVHDVPALLVLGTEDTLVTPRNGGRVARAYRGPKRVVQLPIGHNDSVHAHDHRALAEGLAWLWAQIDAPGTDAS